MPSCNLAESVHHKWLMQSGNTMECLYEATQDDMIRAFMQITNYREWLKGGQRGKGPDKAALKLRAAASSGDPKLIAVAMKSFPGAGDLPDHSIVLEGAEIFGSTKRKLNLPPGSEFDSHRPDKVNYSIPKPNTRSTRQRIEESLKSPQHHVSHATRVMESNCDPKQWHIARLPKSSGRQCQALQSISGEACRTKISQGANGTPAPTYAGMKKDIRMGRNVEAEFFFCPDDIHRCVMGTKRPFVLHWPPVPITWPVKFGTNLTREEVLKLEDAGFQLQQQEALSPRQKFQTQVNIPILRSRFHVPDNMDAHPSMRFGKKCRRSPDAPSADHKNRWMSTGHMNGYYITGVTLVPHPGCGVVITIVNDKDKAYLVSISTIPQCTCEDFVGMSFKAASRKWVPCKHLYYVFRYLCKLNYETDKFIHQPTYSYNEVMQILELAGVVEKE